MSNVAEEFLDGASGRGWERDPLEVVTELRANPGDMGALVIEAVNTGSRRALAGLPWVHDDDLDDVSTAAFARLAADPEDKLAREVADQVVAQQQTAPRALHLVFPHAYRPHGRGLHPTNLPLEGEGTHTLGGTSASVCAICGAPRHAVVRLDPVPEGLGVSIDALSLVTCLSCVGWVTEVLYQGHNQYGEVLDDEAPEGASADESFEVAPLKPVKVGLLDCGPRWRAQPYRLDQNLNKLGGDPTWIRGEAYGDPVPDCDKCGTRMAFLLQLDSGMPDQGGSTFVWGSGGLGYCFWCDGCWRSAWFWQAK